MTEPTDLLQRLTGLLGPAAVIHRGTRSRALCRRLAQALSGQAGLRRAPVLDRTGRPDRADLPRGGRRHRPPGRQYGACRRRGAGRLGHAGRSLPQPHGGHPPCRSRRPDHRGRGRLHPESGAGCRGRGRPPPADQPGGGGLGHHRRGRGGQCGRRERAALRHDPQPRARARGGAARRHHRQWPAPAAQGQCGLRLEAALHRQRGHARHRHGGGPEAAAAAEALRDGAALGRRSGGRPAASGTRPGRAGRPDLGLRADLGHLHAARRQACRPEGSHRRGRMVRADRGGFQPGGPARGGGGDAGLGLRAGDRPRRRHRRVGRAGGAALGPARACDGIRGARGQERQARRLRAADGGSALSRRGRGGAALPALRARA